MFNEKEFIRVFVDAAKNGDEEKMKELSGEVVQFSLEYRKELIEAILNTEEAVEFDEKLTKGLEDTVDLIKMAVIAQDSAGEEGKDKSEPEEVTQDVAADTSADETKVESGGYAPTEEEKAEKDEEK